MSAEYACQRLICTLKVEAKMGTRSGIGGFAESLWLVSGGSCVGDGEEILMANHQVADA